MSSNPEGSVRAVDDDEPVYLGFHAPGDAERFQDYRTQWDAPPGPVELHRVHGPVARINIYVGANNSGKSRLLRALLHAQPPTGLRASVRGLWARAVADLKAMRDEYPPDSKSLLLSFDGKTVVYDVKRYIAPIQLDWAWKQLQRWPLHALLRPDPLTRDAVLAGSEPSPSSFDHECASLKFALWNSIISLTYSESKPPVDSPVVPIEVLSQQRPNLAKFQQVLDLRPAIAAAPKIYIPVLRSAHTLHGGGHKRDLTGDIFLKTVVENYNIRVSDVEPRIEVFTGLQLYEQILRDRCGPKSMRERIDTFEAFLGRQFFGGQAVEIVSRYTANRAEQHIFVKIGTREERELHNLGDGINALILVLYKVFMAEAGTWLFIEEPELNLHPGLQRIFLDTLLHDPSVRERALRIFMTTHSNHLVGMAMHHPGEISVFAVTPETPDASRFLVRTVQGPELALLDELGVDNASVFLANCSLWVEGPSDRIYLRAFLAAHARASGRPFREDLDFSFFEFGGSNFKHYVFGALEEVDCEKIRAQFVANRVFLLADHDNEPGKYDGLRAAAEAGGGAFEFATTEPAREIENLLSVPALSAIFRYHGEAIDPALKSVEPETLPWATLTADEWSKGKYSENLARVFAGTSGADVVFAKKKTAMANALARAIENEQLDWEDLGDSTRTLTLQIVAFIERHNPGRAPSS